MKNNILIIGATGFIGKNIIQTLLHTGNKLVLLRRSFSTISDTLKNNPLIKWINADLKNNLLIQEVIEKNNINIVIHLASSLVPSSSEESFNGELSNIILPTFKLIDYCLNHNIKFIFFSSGGTIYGKVNSKTISENDSRNPINYYGYSKLLIEEYILFKHRDNQLKYLILRPSNVYGRYQRVDKNQGFIAVAIDKILHDKTIEIWGDGEVIRDYINVEDVAIITKKLIENNIENKILNIGSGEGYSLNEILTIFSSNFSKDIKVKYTEKRTVDVDKMILDVSLLRENIDFTLTPLDRGISQYIDYLGLQK